MGKGGDGGFLTPKAIANRIKAKGLNKLRWYCQMCQKSCRDENGFKCHCMSESHLRQMALFRERPNQYMGDFSRQFENGFVRILKIRGKSRVLANSIYQEYIADRHHIHMKATQWETLASFVQYLGRTGQAEIDETPRGWFVKYIDRDPKTLAQREADERNKKQAVDDVQLQERMLERQIEEAKQLQSVSTDQPAELDRTDEGSKIGFAIPTVPESLMQTRPAGNVFQKLDSSNSHSQKEQRQKRSAVETLMKEIQAKQRRVEVWITKGLIVKVNNKKLKDGIFYRKKGEIIEVIEPSTARVQLLDDDRPILRIDQSELETVIPAIGGQVRIVAGDRQRDKIGYLASIEESSYSATIRFGATLIPGFAYDHFYMVDLLGLLIQQGVRCQDHFQYEIDNKRPNPRLG